MVKLLEEYKEANALHRQQNNPMFGELTVFLATNLVLFQVLAIPSPLIRIMVAISGILLACAFHIIQNRLADFSHVYRSRAKEIETILGFSIHVSPQPKYKWFTAIFAQKIIYKFFIFLWSLCLIYWFFKHHSLSLILS